MRGKIGARYYNVVYVDIGPQHATRGATLLREYPNFIYD